jgi:hypothetical protein
MISTRLTHGSIMATVREDFLNRCNRIVTEPVPPELSARTIIRMDPTFGLTVSALRVYLARLLAIREDRSSRPEEFGTRRVRIIQMGGPFFAEALEEPAHLNAHAWESGSISQGPALVPLR